MPKIYKKRGARKPRRRAAKRGVRSALTTVNRSLVPFANRYITRMKYATNFNTASAGGGASGTYQFRINSVFRPEIGGHQPIGFDQLSTLYNRYRVISCAWRIQNPMAPTGQFPTVTSCLASNDASVVFANQGEMNENSRTKYITQNPGSAAQTLSGKIYMPTLMGRTKAQYMADDSFQAIVTADPVEAAYLYIQTFNALSGTQNPLQPCQIILTFEVEWFDSKRVLQS